MSHNLLFTLMLQSPCQETATSSLVHWETQKHGRAFFRAPGDQMSQLQRPTSKLQLSRATEHTETSHCLGFSFFSFLSFFSPFLAEPCLFGVFFSFLDFLSLRPVLFSLSSFFFGVVSGFSASEASLPRLSDPSSSDCVTLSALRLDWPDVLPNSRMSLKNGQRSDSYHGKCPTNLGRKHA